MLNNKRKKFKILNKRKKIKKRKNEFNIFIIINIRFLIIKFNKKTIYL